MNEVWTSKIVFSQISSSHSISNYRLRHCFRHVVFFQMMRNSISSTHSNFSWRGRCRIIESDMRCLPAVARDLGLPQPDIVVSELLGSFGDNELSPECLDGVTSFLKPTTINIPQSYISYAGRRIYFIYWRCVVHISWHWCQACQHFYRKIGWQLTTYFQLLWMYTQKDV